MTKHTAICTHCGKPIYRFDKQSWEHVEPIVGLKSIACYKIVLATPRRGSTKNEF